MLSTPPTNTPTDRNRRRFLSVAAGGAVAAALPVAALANGPDPIFATIERHRELSADYTAAVDISSKLEDGPEFEAADEIAGDRCGDLLDHADALIHLEPTTMAGVSALMRYVASLEEWQTPRDSYRMMTQGGVASAVIDLADGETKTLIIRHVSEQP